MTKDRGKDRKRRGTAGSDAPASRNDAAAKAEADRRLDAELADSFPASDPPSILRRGPKDP